MGHRPEFVHSGIGPEQCLVWLADPDQLSAPEILNSYLEILCEDERQQMQRFHFARDSHTYLIAHALARMALSQCVADVPPQAWRFEKSAYGRPEISTPQASPHLRFNISHCHGLVAVVVTPGIDCGIDVEALDRNVETQSLERGVMGATERANLSSAVGEERATLFFQYWTLKEAHAKARGLGLSLAIDQYEFQTDVNPVTMSINAAMKEDDATDWQFEQWPVSPDHVLALALRRGGEADRSLTCHRLIADGSCIEI